MGVRLVDETFGGTRVLVDSFGSPPKLLAAKCIKGNGLNISVRKPNGQEILSLGQEQTINSVDTREF